MAVRLLAALVPFLLLTACASKAPEAIRSPVPGAPDFAAVQEDPAAYTGERVRWGGTIATVHNREAGTRLEVVARPLASQGKPRSEDTTPGRFLAEVPGFLDPAVYSRGRKVTVRGALAGAETGAVGEFSYQFPVVRVEEHYLWPLQKPLRRQAPPPMYYDPWYDPWYPYYGPRHPYW